MPYLDISKYKRKMDEARERWAAAQNLEEADRVPVMITTGGPFRCNLLGYTFKDYYRDFDICYKVQLEGLKWCYEVLDDDRFETIGSIGDFFPDLGETRIGVVFDCEIALPDEGRPWLSPWILPRIKTVDDIEDLEVPDPMEVDKKLERYLLRAYGKGVKTRPIQILPPLSTAGSLMGTDRLFTFLYRYPTLMHGLLERLVETFIELQKHSDEYYGVTTESVGLYDDHAGFLNESMFRKFVLPYNQRIYDKFGPRWRFMHMDSDCGHLAHVLVNELKIDSLEVAPVTDIAKLKEVTDGRVVLRGNLDYRVFSKSISDLRQEVDRCIRSAAPGGGYIFDATGEGAYVGMAIDKLCYAVAYAKKIAKYPNNEVF